MEAKTAKPKKKKKKAKAKRRGPQSKYDPEMHPHLVKHMCLNGMTNEAICKALKISVDTLWKWRKKYPELTEALKTSKKVAISKVEQSLFKRTQGYDYEEVEIIAENKADGTSRPLKIKKTKKHVPPDTGACAFWLKAQAGWRESEQQGNVFNIMNGVLIVPGTQAPEDWDTASQQVHEKQLELLSQG
jgi:transposase-like protein